MRVRKIRNLQLLSAIGFTGKVVGGLHLQEDRGLVYPVGVGVGVWDREGGRHALLHAHTRPVTALAVSRSGQIIVSAQYSDPGCQARVVVWQYQTRQEYGSYSIHKEEVAAVGVTAGEEYVASLGGLLDGYLVIWHIPTRRPLCSVMAGEPGLGTATLLCTAPNTPTLMIVGGTRMLRAWSLNPHNNRLTPTPISLGLLERNYTSLQVDEAEELLYAATTTGDVVKVRLNMAAGQASGAAVLMSVMAPRPTPTPGAPTLSRASTPGIRTLLVLPGGDLLVGDLGGALRAYRQVPDEREGGRPVCSGPPRTHGTVKYTHPKDPTRPLLAQLWCVEVGSGVTSVSMVGHELVVGTVNSQMFMLQLPLPTTTVIKSLPYRTSANPHPSRTSISIPRPKLTDPNPRPSKPTDPNPRSSKPTNPNPRSSKPTDPNQRPSKPTDPNPRPSKPTDPNPRPSKPTDPNPRPSKPTDPNPRPSKPTDPNPRPSKPTDPNPRPSNPTASTYTQQNKTNGATKNTKTIGKGRTGTEESQSSKQIATKTNKSLREPSRQLEDLPRLDSRPPEITLLSTCHSEPIHDLTFPRGVGELVVSAGVGGLRVWNVRSLDEVLRVELPGLVCCCCSVTPTLNVIVTGWSDGRLRGLGAESGHVVWLVDEAHHGGVNSVTTLRSGHLVSGGRDGRVRVWLAEGPGMRMAASQKEHRGEVTYLALAPSETRVLSCSSDGSCILWQLPELDRIYRLTAHTVFLGGRVLSSGEVATVGSDGSILVWDHQDGALLADLPASTRPITTVTTTADDATLVTAGEDAIVRVWNWNKGRVTHEGRGHSGAITRICLSPSGKILASVGKDGALLLWKIPELKT